VECNYPITDLKGLAVIWIVKKFKRYLWNILFIIITDHSALKYIFGCDEIPDRRKGRWIVYLQQFNYTIKYQAGKKMSYVNYLLRNSINEAGNLKEVAFIRNVAYEITKFDLAFIYNHYELIISIRIGDHMKGLY